MLESGKDSLHLLLKVLIFFIRVLVGFLLVKKSLGRGRNLLTGKVIVLVEPVPTEEY